MGALCSAQMQLNKAQRDVKKLEKQYGTKEKKSKTKTKRHGKSKNPAADNPLYSSDL